MGTQDISRSAFTPEKHYSSVRLQQGRVILDDDWNENRRIREELWRQTAIDVIGPAGSPNDGFRISNPRVSARGIDFDIAAGDFYLGGYCLTLEQAQTFLLQGDWLQGPPAVDAPAGNRTDLVYLETFQQVVTAVEDAELFEVALGGADTTTRMRTVQRVHLAEAIGTANCKQAWNNFQQSLASLGTWTDEQELLPNAELVVAFGDTGNGGDLCKPLPAGGYLGAENQAIRVQLIDEEHFTWGFDNAAPLYRVQVDSDRTAVTLLTAPKDQAHWPMAEQIVEILPWASVLPNNEKVAAIHGHLSRVTASYNPDTGEIGIADSVPTEDFDNWQNREDQLQLADGGEYYYLRVWNRGSDRDSDDAIEFSPGNPVTLGNTGIEITFNGDQFITGDYWIITARPQTPNVIVPWVLETGRGHQGVRRFYSTLGLIHWSANDEPTVTDCRPRFRALTRQKICCSLVVGDGVNTHGDFDSIEEAVARLPEEGGEICLLPGLHQTNTVIAQRKSITIKGCGHRTRLIPRQEQRQQPIFTITDSTDLSLLNMELVALDSRAIVLSGSEPGLLHGINIHDNAILGYRNAIHGLQTEFVSIKTNRIRMLDKAGGDVAIYMLGDDVLIQDNDIGVLPPDVVPPKIDSGGADNGDNPNPANDCLDPEGFYLNPGYISVYMTYVWSYVLTLYVPKNPYKTLGGIQIGSGSERVEIRHNQIIGGAGNGITLGSDAELADFEEPVPPVDFTVDLDEGSVVGFAYYKGEPYSNGVVVFTKGNILEEAISNEEGYFSTEIDEAGSYDLSLSDPEFKITGVEEIDAGEFGRYYQVTIEDSDLNVDLQDVLAFIYQVTIEHNRIQSMGESGIGFPRIDSEQIMDVLLQLLQQKSLSGATRILLLLSMLLFGAYTGMVMQLIIRNNLISGCLRNIYEAGNDDLGRQFRGVGGISLAFCDDVYIYDNRIENNGSEFRGPLQGIFAIYTSHAEISRNHIVDNGPKTPAQIQNPLIGGIMIFVAADLASLGAGNLQSSVNTNTGAASGSATANVHVAANLTSTRLTGSRLRPLQVLRLHENVVEQALGRGFACVLGAGGMSIADNQLISNYSTAKDFDETVLAGITNIRVPSLVFISALRQLSNSAGAFYLANQGAVGNNKVIGNQVTLLDPQLSGVSVSIFSLNGIQFAHNHIQAGAGDLTSNVLLMSTIVDGSHNHIQEASNLGNGKETPFDPVSMVTLGLQLNTTALNQSDHCIIAIGDSGLLQDVGNLVLTDTDGTCAALLTGYRDRLMEYANNVLNLRR